MRGCEATGLGWNRGRPKARVTVMALGKKEVGSSQRFFNPGLGAKTWLIRHSGTMLEGWGRKGKKRLSRSCMKHELYIINGPHRLM